MKMCVCFALVHQLSVLMHSMHGAGEAPSSRAARGAGIVVLGAVCTHHPTHGCVSGDVCLCAWVGVGVWRSEDLCCLLGMWSVFFCVAWVPGYTYVHLVCLLLARCCSAHPLDHCETVAMHLCVRQFHVNIDLYVSSYT